MRVRRIALGVTGASRARYGLRLLQELLRIPGTEVHLSISPSAREVLRIEEDVTVDLERFDPRALGVKRTRRLVYHPFGNLAAAIASGSFPLDAMAIVPCSMSCVGRLASGVSGDLIERAGDVCLKEQRRLVIVPRETPFSAVHLENLLKLSRLGVIILPAAPGFYGKPRRVEDLVDFIVGRVLDHLGVNHQLGPRWGSEGA